MEGPLCRCRWADLSDPLYVAYHDNEWGVPCRDDRLLFELLLLEGFQAGLSWKCVLHKRESLRAAFDGFDPEVVSRYGPEKLAQLMDNPGVIRNRLKLRAAVTNAQVFLSIQREFGSFSDYLWGFTQGQVIRYGDGLLRATSPLSDMISQELKRRGMKFVGSTIIYAYLQAVGVINDHEPTCAWFLGRP